MKDFVPNRESELVTYSQNFDSKITAAPVSFSLTVEMAAQYHTLSVAFINAYLLCQNQMTRSPGNVQIKNDAKIALIAYLRELAKVVQSSPTVTNGQREELNLPIHDTNPSPIPVPTTAPILTVESVTGNLAKVRLANAASPSSRAKPANVKGANVFSFAGENAPTDPSQWKLVGAVTRTVFEVEFDSTIEPGSKVWLTACWFNPRSQVGPASNPIFTYTQLGGTTVEFGQLKMAA